MFFYNNERRVSQESTLSVLGLLFIGIKNVG